jgi:hypothetical protein
MNRYVVAAAALLAVSAQIAWPGPSQGILFDKMPVGCKIRGVYSSGEKIVEEYNGLSGGLHVMTTHEDRPGRKLIRTTFYNSDGWMVQKRWATGQWETFTPYSCFQQVGTCKYVLKNIDGVRKTFKGKVTASGSDLVSSGGFVGEAPFPDTRVRLGPFNVQTFFDDGSLSYKATKFVGCDLAG